MLGIVYPKTDISSDFIDLGVNPPSAWRNAVRNEYGNRLLCRRCGIMDGREEQRRNGWCVRSAELDEPAPLLVGPLDLDDCVEPHGRAQIGEWRTARHWCDGPADGPVRANIRQIID